MLFDTLTLHDIQAKLATTTTQAQAALFYAGDHWQQAAGYVGPRPGPTDPEYARVMAEIQRGFVARNVIAEAVDRHVNGVVGRDIVWRIAAPAAQPAPTAAPAPPAGQAQPVEDPPAEDPRIALARELLEGWIDHAGAQDTIDQAVASLMHAGRAPLRILIPPGKRNAAGLIPMGPIEQQIRLIYMDHPTPAECGVIVDPKTRERAGAYVYVDEDDGLVRGELTYRQGDRLIWRMFRAARGEEEVYTLGLAGQTIPIYEMARRPLISDQVMSQQKLYNLAATMKQRNVVLGGFLERTLLNAQLAGETQTVNGKEIFVPDPISFGAGRINSFVGQVAYDAAGNERIAQPEIIYRDPVPVDTFEATERSAYLAILGECHQLHYAIAGDATPSGESRIAAMADYVIDLLKTKKRVDDAWAWMGSTVLNLAAALAGQPGLFADLTVEADAQIDAGPVSTEMMRATIELVRDRLLSADTGRSWIGVTDTQAEAEKIADEQAGAAAGAMAEIDRILAMDAQGRQGQPDQNEENA